MSSQAVWLIGKYHISKRYSVLLIPLDYVKLGGKLPIMAPAGNVKSYRWYQWTGDGERIQLGGSSNPIKVRYREEDRDRQREKEREKGVILFISRRCSLKRLRDDTHRSQKSRRRTFPEWKKKLIYQQKGREREKKEGAEITPLKDLIKIYTCTVHRKLELLCARFNASCLWVCCCVWMNSKSNEQQSSQMSR